MGKQSQQAQDFWNLGLRKYLKLAGFFFPRFRNGLVGFCLEPALQAAGRWEKLDRLDSAHQQKKREVKRFPPHNASPRCKHASLGVERHRQTPRSSSCLRAREAGESLGFSRGRHTLRRSRCRGRVPARR